MSCPGGRRTMLSSSIHFVRDHLFTLPVLAKFALGMVMLAVIPLVSRRLHIPAAVGLLLGGGLGGHALGAREKLGHRLAAVHRIV